MLTTSTITDEQIRELKRREVERAKSGIGGELLEVCVENILLCDQALGIAWGPDTEIERVWARITYGATVDRARARCAEILNARIAARRCFRCGALCDHEAWDGINCPWCLNARASEAK